MALRVYGKNPSGKRLERIQNSPNYREGAFQNLHPTLTIAPESSFAKVFVAFLNKPKNTKPPAAIPHIRTDLKNLQDNTIVWFGHSSYFLRIDGLNILVDPVFNGNAAPFSFMVKAFPGSNVYSAADFPPIDILILSHDHYDHMDYPTLVRMKENIKSVYCPLGVGSHLEYWGFSPDIIMELDWWETATAVNGIRLTAAPARHFSGRGTKRAQTLWASFILKTNALSLYLGGDSGYDTHFRSIGEQYGPFDLAILECGQYNTAWPHIHMMPEETVQAAIDLQAKVLMPVHWAKFSLALHPWDESIKRVVKSAEERNVQITTPVIGEPVVLNASYPTEKWWAQI
jgi:L-ascorbate metabolism protein UlaG (beta-lactamase superfamily)